MNWLKLTFLVPMATLVLLGAGCSDHGKKQTSKPGQEYASLQDCQKAFNSMDTYHDYLLTQKEFMAAPPKVSDPQAFFKSLDANGDGVLSEAEFCAAYMPSKAKG